MKGTPKSENAQGGGLVIDSIVDDIMDHWEPFMEATSHNIDPAMKKIADAVDPDILKGTVLLNNLYQVNIHRVKPQEGWPDMFHLSIKRRDKSPVHDWRHLQRIKNEVVGPEHEAVELYPAESRLVDGANQYHLWVLATPGMKFPFGFEERFVSNISELGAVQRPFPKDATPPDVTSMAAYAEKRGIKL